MTSDSFSRVESSFRDPSGFVFVMDGSIYRQINNKYKDNYNHLMNSGLYDTLVKKNLLIPHQEIAANYANNPGAYKIIKPLQLSFVSYPYEWCFNQLKAAALTTLKIQKTALDFAMTLKDSSAYNIQFFRGKPILIDTLSFEKYREGTTWTAYKQFCQHFLAPLLLMKHSHINLGQLSRVFMDGIPLDLVSAILPKTTKLKFSILTHIHLHSRSQKKYADKKIEPGSKKISKFNFLALIDNLETTIQKLNWNNYNTEWADYYDKTNYSTNAFEHKKELISRYLDRLSPKTIWDMGANNGIFSQIASAKGIEVISFDIDPSAVEKNYLGYVVKNKNTKILPLILDITNPSPGIGWENEERISLIKRGPADTVMALALIHHLAISNNTPLNKIAGFFSRIGKNLIIEFVPKTDSQVQILLGTREDIFDDYNEDSFEQTFGKYFEILDKQKIKDSERNLYLMKKR